MGRSASLIAGAVLIAGGAGVAAYGARRSAEGGESAPAADAPKIASAIGGTIREVRAGLAARTRTLADLPRLAAAVATDKATVEDLTNDERAFRVGERETIELGQVAVATGKATSLLRLPADAAMSPFLDKPGSYLLPGGGDDALMATEVREIMPTERADQLRGAIAVSLVIDIAPHVAPLRDKGVAARIDLGDGKSLAIGGDPGQDAPPTPIDGVPGASLVVAATKPAMSSDLGWLLWVGIGVAALGLVVLGLGLRKRPAVARDIEPVAPILAMPTVPSRAPMPSPNPNGVAQGTPFSATIAGAIGPATPLPSTQISAQVAAAMTAEGAGGGPVLGRYQLVKRLGSGGMADVFLARKHGEAGFAKLVALKLLHNHLAQKPQAVAHFLDEARLASNLSHSNIVQIIDLGKVDDAYFIAMEFVEGSDLERVIQAGRLAGRQVPLAIAMSILRRVCDGLDAAHRALAPDGAPLNIVHRDVKSGNVLISRQGQVKISDFGIAKANTQVHTTQIGETKGTPSVMAPEQRMGQAVDVRADVYAVAAMGYEVFTSAEINLDLVQLAALGVDGWPHLPPPSDVRDELPRELDALLLGALAFQPDARPPDCRAMEEQLAAIATRYDLVASDKDIARWVEGELGRMAPAGGSPLVSSSPSPGAA